MASYKETSSVSQMFWSHIFVIKGTALLSRGPNIQYIMTHNLCCITIFLFIFSSPTYDWCDTEGQQRTTILGVWGRQSWTGNHGNTVLASLIPWPCQRVDKYLRMPRSIQHLHKRKPSHSARYEKKNTQGRMVLMDCISISHTHVFYLLSLVFFIKHWQSGYTFPPLITCNKIAFT